MDKRERIRAEMEAMLKEHLQPLRGAELVQSRLRWENWLALRKEAVAHAGAEVKRRKWRGVHGGVLPKGYEAEDIADQAIAEMLSGSTRLVLGWTWEKLVKELKRLVGQRVRTLHHLAEANGTVSEWEVPATPAEGEEAVSVLETLADEATVPNEAASERAEAKQEFIEALEKSLDSEPELKALLSCLREGVTRPAALATRLATSQPEVSKLRKRLERRVRKFLARSRNGLGAG